MKILLILLCVCLVSACAMQSKPVAKKTPTAVVNTSSVNKSTAAIKIAPAKNIDATEFLTFAESYSNLPLDAQKQTLLETNQVLAANPNDLLHRMKLVMIYGLPSSSLLDTSKAQQLLKKVMQEDILANSQLAFANLLFDYLAVVNKLNKNSEPRRADSLQQKNEALQQKLAATQQKLEAAQQKLDDLKKIEQSMGERDAAPKK